MPSGIGSFSSPICLSDSEDESDYISAHKFSSGPSTTYNTTRKRKASPPRLPEAGPSGKPPTLADRWPSKRRRDANTSWEEQERNEQQQMPYDPSSLPARFNDGFDYGNPPPVPTMHSSHFALPPSLPFSNMPFAHWNVSEPTPPAPGPGIFKPVRRKEPSTRKPPANGTRPIPQASSRRIGMDAERDPTGRRRTFKVTPATIVDALPSITPGPYRPFPAHCLVLDQLSKNCRSAGYLRDWARRVADCVPAFLAIETSTASAIVEFPSEARAKRAWASPKLGDPAMSAIKGASREDLICAWWYEPKSPAPYFPVKELEDGEIEDEEALREAYKVTRKKESKKEAAAQKVKDGRTKVEARRPASEYRLPTQADASSCSLPSFTFEMPSSPISPHTFQPVSPMRSRYPMFDLPSPTTAIATAMRSAVPPVSPQMVRRAPLPPQDNLAPRWRPANTNGTSVDDDSDDEIIEIPPPYPRPQFKPKREASVLAMSEPRKSLESQVSPARDSAMEAGSQLASSQERAAALRRKLEVARLRTAAPPTPPRSHTPTSPIEVAFVNDVEMPSATAPTRLPSPTGQQLSLPPSEPRAMKNLPKAPTFAIRKDLQARLAQTKLESAMVAQSTASAYPPTPSEDDNATEEHLRKLVLASKRKKPTTESRAPPTPSPTVDVVMDDLPPPTSSMDDLAMSFINDAIQSAAAPQAEALAHPTSTIPTTANSLAVSDPQERDRLAMKQMALAEQIRESKLFMHRLQAAQTKAEKLQIMKEMKKADEVRAMKEKSLDNRLQRESSVRSTAPVEATTIWPNVPCGPLIVSDSDDSDEE